MGDEVSLDGLWHSAPAPAGVFSRQHIETLPEPARRLLEHAIAPGTPLASAVRLQMHGEIKLGRWLPFRASQVIRRDGNMLWRATMNPWGVPLFRGFDRLVDGAGEMQWKLLGLVPVVTASGPDITHSAAGRARAESIWLPSLLCGNEVSWTSTDPSHATATVSVAGATSPVDFAIDGHGRLSAVRVSRWGNPPPEPGRFQSVDFGGVLEEERTFAGYTIPVRVRVGWHIGSPRFASEGEFFRATIDEAAFR